MTIVEKIALQTGKTEDELKNDFCILDYGYEHHFACDEEHCEACWDQRDPNEKVLEDCPYCQNDDVCSGGCKAGNTPYHYERAEELN